MSSRDDIQQFLTSRRAKITPEQAGLASYGRRRVPGLRREEVAMLTQVSVDYYGRLERGNLKGVSESVLASLVRALQLDDVEERHLRDLMRASSTEVRPARHRPAPTNIRPAVQRMLDAMGELPAVIQNGRLDIVAANRMGRALYFDQFDTPTPPANHARFTFLDPRGRQFAPNWEQAANDIVAILRAEAGRDPHDRQLTDLIGELSTRSDEFRIRWAAHNVHQHKSGSKRIHHRAVGEMALDFEVMTLEGDPTLRLVVFSAEPQSPSHDSLQLLSNWAATLENTERADSRKTT
ncbi:helix-turn-helix transcriptional regulator [Paeniglutamicibacter sp. ORCA_105]|uniref:helix-turn-helix transcriptional regulator n=1 Tax=Paeniglutamicibacter sp. ORCA_105 TaxID=3377336 RepID=UPI00389550A0